MDNVFTVAYLVGVALARQLERLNETGEELLARVVQIIGQLLVLLQHFLHYGWHCGVESHLGAWVLAQAEVTLDDVLEKAR